VKTFKELCKDRGIEPNSTKGRIYQRSLTIPQRAHAIKSFCHECQGWDDGSFEAIKICPIQSCPLWLTRPYQTPESP
jgi:hypothetical protein